jgi:parvulin-like peptidyl-prolyl isomerase
LRERILNGENFGKLAREYSGDESSAARGGDLGWVRRGDQTETVDDYIWIAPLGEVSGVLVSPYGLHLLLVTERHFSDAEEYEKQLKERVLDSLQQTPETATP